jgi:DNA-binding transcriptional MerR regulator
MDGDTLYSIGDLARRTGLSVRTIRFYSDRGVLPPTSRSPAGYRRYDVDALARLDLIGTLRDLGVDLATIQRVLDREISVPEVAAAHAQALEVQIHTLRLRRAVLRAVAKRGSSPQEMELMHKLVKLSEVERRRIIHQFIDEAFGDLDANPDLVAMLRSAMPELSDDPTPEQVDAWVELAELVQDPDFKGERAAGGGISGGRTRRRRPVGVAPRADQPAPAAGRGGAGRRDRPSIRAGPYGPQRSGRPVRPNLRQGRHPRLPQQAAGPTADRQRPTG